MSEQESNGVADKAPSTSTNLGEVLDELNAGVFASQVGRALSDVAMGVVTHGDKGKKGKVTITFDMTRIGESNQVNVKHSLAYVKPTHRGKSAEDATTETPMHVGRGGKLTLVPDTQSKFAFGE